MSRSTVAVPCGEPSRRQRSRAISAASGAGDAVPFRTEAPRLGNPPPSSPRRSDVNPRERPCSRRRSHPMPGSLGAHDLFHASRLRPFDPRPAPALLGRAGSHAGRRPARAATLFRVLRPMHCAREQREKLTSGDFYNHVRLRFLPCSGARPPPSGGDREPLGLQLVQEEVERVRPEGGVRRHEALRPAPHVRDHQPRPGREHKDSVGAPRARRRVLHARPLRRIHPRHHEGAREPLRRQARPRTRGRGGKHGLKEDFR